MVRTQGERRDVRLIGIDTPEVFGGEECGAAEASDSMGQLLHEGNRVKLLAGAKAPATPASRIAIITGPTVGADHAKPGVDLRGFAP